MHKNTTPRPPLVVALLCLGYMALVLIGLRALFAWAAWPLLVGTEPSLSRAVTGPGLAPFGPVFWSAFGYGALFDVRLAALLSLPLGMGLSLPPVARQFTFTNVFGMYFPVLWVVLFVYVVDVFLFTDWGMRVSFMFFADSWGLSTLLSSYSRVWLAVGITLAAGLVAAGLAWLGSIPLARSSRYQTAYACFFLGAVLWIMALHGQPFWGSKPLQASALPFPPYSTARTLATNPVQNIMDTMRVAP